AVLMVFAITSCDNAPKQDKVAALTFITEPVKDLQFAPVTKTFAGDEDAKNYVLEHYSSEISGYNNLYIFYDSDEYKVYTVNFEKGEYSNSGTVLNQHLSAMIDSYDCAIIGTYTADQPV
ncbi:MAG: hypothetical protein KBS81_10445, partial [Spirochaetales bacterium]|nr:hypothetical protein [Candidatus Physcosoma equi]